MILRPIIYPDPVGWDTDCAELIGGVIIFMAGYALLVISISFVKKVIGQGKRYLAL